MKIGRMKPSTFANLTFSNQLIILLLFNNYVNIIIDQKQFQSILLLICVKQNEINDKPTGTVTSATSNGLWPGFTGEQVSELLLTSSCLQQWPELGHGS